MAVRYPCLSALEFLVVLHGSIHRDWHAILNLFWNRGFHQYTSDNFKLFVVAERAMCWESLLWARTAVLSRGFNLMLNNERKEVLVPLFDMLDHLPSARYVLHWRNLINFCFVAGAIVGVFLGGSKACR
jgi:hypothetical protein